MSATTTPFMQISGLRKSYGTLEILKGIDIELDEGGFLVLIGCPSTLMVPLEIGSNPAIVLSKVDLPQPDGPTKTKKPPSSSSMSMPLRISSVP